MAKLFVEFPVMEQEEFDRLSNDITSALRRAFPDLRAITYISGNHFSGMRLHFLLDEGETLASLSAEDGIKILSKKEADDIEKRLLSLELKCLEHMDK